MSTSAFADGAAALLFVAEALFCAVAAGALAFGAVFDLVCALAAAANDSNAIRMNERKRLCFIGPSSRRLSPASARKAAAETARTGWRTEAALAALTTTARTKRARRLI